VRDGLEAAGAETVDGLGGDRIGPTRQEDRAARDVEALLRLGHGAAENHIVHQLGLEPGDAADRLLDHERSQVVGTRIPEGALERAAHGGADGAGDGDVEREFHGTSASTL
jgi:hypothetical protein